MNFYVQNREKTCNKNKKLLNYIFKNLSAPEFS